MFAWVTIISIILFVISVFIWIYDHEREKIPRFQEGHPVTFMDYVKKMAPLSAILLVVGFLYLLIIQFTGILPLLYDIL